MLNITGRAKLSTLPHFPRDSESTPAQGLLIRLISVIKKNPVSKTPGGQGRSEAKTTYQPKRDFYSEEKCTFYGGIP